MSDNISAETLIDVLDAAADALDAAWNLLLDLAEGAETANHQAPDTGRRPAAYAADLRLQLQTLAVRARQGMDQLNGADRQRISLALFDLRRQVYGTPYW